MQHGFLFCLDSASRFRLFFNDSVQATRLEKTFVKTYTTSKWHYVIVTCNRTSGIATLYVDGAADSSTLNISAHLVLSGRASATRRLVRTRPEHIHFPAASTNGATAKARSPLRPRSPRSTTRATGCTGRRSRRAIPTCGRRSRTAGTATSRRRPATCSTARARTTSRPSVPSCSATRRSPRGRAGRGRIWWRRIRGTWSVRTTRRWTWRRRLRPDSDV